MRLDRSFLLVLASVVPLAACDITDATGIDPNAPSNLAPAHPSGDPNAPLGVILSWDAPSSGRAIAFDVFGRTSSNSDWQLRATTTSPSFHDLYTELAVLRRRPTTPTAIPRRDPRDHDRHASELPAPLGLHSISLNGAIQLLGRATRSRRTAARSTTIASIRGCTTPRHSSCLRGPRRIDGLGRISRRQSAERRDAMLGRERGESRRTRECLERGHARHAAIRRSERARLRTRRSRRQRGSSSTMRARIRMV